MIVDIIDYLNHNKSYHFNLHISFFAYTHSQNDIEIKALINTYIKSNY